MQVLSQLSYNPTVGPLIGAAIGRHPGRTRRPAARQVSSASSCAGLHHPGSLSASEGSAYCSRVIAFVSEDSMGSRRASIGGRLLPIDTSLIFTI
jgi:hypothetical protein